MLGSIFHFELSHIDLLYFRDAETVISDLFFHLEDAIPLALEGVPGEKTQIRRSIICTKQVRASWRQNNDTGPGTTTEEEIASSAVK